MYSYILAATPVYASRGTLEGRRELNINFRKRKTVLKMGVFFRPHCEASLKGEP